MGLALTYFNEIGSKEKDEETTPTKKKPPRENSNQFHNLIRIYNYTFISHILSVRRRFKSGK